MPENKIYKPSYLALISYIIPLGFLFLYSFINIFTAIFFGIFLIIMGGIGILFGFLSIYYTSYELRPDGFFIRRGIIAKSQTLLLYSQIQDVTEYKNLFSMIFGLKQLHIETMTATSSFAGRLALLKDSDADELKQELLKSIHSKGTSSSKKSAAPVVAYNEKEETKEENVNPYPIHFVALGLIAIGAFFLVGLIASIILLFFAPIASFFVVLIFGFLIVITIIASAIQQATFKYWIGNNSITIKSGLLNTQKTVMEYRKLQDYIQSQGILDRIFGYSTIRFETGATPTYGGTNTYGQKNQQRPNYSVSALKLQDANTLSMFIMKKLGIKYFASSESLVNRYPLSKKKIAKKIISGTIWQIIFIMVFSTLLYFSIQNINLSYISMGAILLFLFMFIFNVIYQLLYFKNYYYDLSKDTLTIRKGAIGWNQIYLPFEKVQNVFIDQDLLDRIFGIYDVHVSTVGFSSIRLCHIDGLTKDNAQAVRDILLKNIKDNIS